MVDSEYVRGNYKTLKISIAAVIKNQGMIRFPPDYLKTKNICKQVVKKLPFLIRYVPDEYKTQANMWEKCCRK